MHDDADDVSKTRFLDAILAAAIFATSPADIGGVIVDCDAGPRREQWLALLRALLPADAPVRRIPAHICDDRLLGGLDLAATLTAGRPIVQRGLLADADNGIVVLPSAERVSPATASRLASALDLREVILERDGLTRHLPARFGIVALLESAAEDDRPPAVLSDRLALNVDLKLSGETDFADAFLSREEVEMARDRLSSVSLGDKQMLVICETASLLGVSSLNVLLHAARVACIVSALDGRECVSESDALATIRLVIAPRATRLPGSSENPPPESEQQTPAEENKDGPDELKDKQFRDVVLAAVKASLPPHLLSLLQSNDRSRSHRSASGRAGETRKSPRRGRPAGTKPGAVGTGARLNVVETLRAAAPWQSLRRRDQTPDELRSSRQLIAVRAQDFRIWRLKNRGASAIVFIVDASGSTAVQRLAEAKGAVELLLADCYRRRDHVALIAFSGRGAELLLPPTRSLARAKRNLADLPGGGGSPIASGIATASLLCEAIRRKGQTPSIVMLTDGRANLCRDGKAGRARAEEESLVAAREVRAMGVASLVIDSSSKPHAAAAGIAEAMGATYFPLPHADARTLSEAVRAQMPRSGPWTTG